MTLVDNLRAKAGEIRQKVRERRGGSVSMNLARRPMLSSVANRVRSRVEAIRSRRRGMIGAGAPAVGVGTGAPVMIEVPPPGEAAGFVGREEVTPEMLEFEVPVLGPTASAAPTLQFG